MDQACKLLNNVYFLKILARSGSLILTHAILIFRIVQVIGLQCIYCIECKLTNSVVFIIYLNSGPGCSKLTTPLVNVSLKFQMSIWEICQYFLLEK